MNEAFIDRPASRRAVFRCIDVIESHHGVVPSRLREYPSRWPDRNPSSMASTSAHRRLSDRVEPGARLIPHRGPKASNGESAWPDGARADPSLALPLQHLYLLCYICLHGRIMKARFEEEMIVLYSCVPWRGNSSPHGLMIFATGGHKRHLPHRQHLGGGTAPLAMGSPACSNRRYCINCDNYAGEPDTTRPMTASMPCQDSG